MRVKCYMKLIGSKIALFLAFVAAIAVFAGCSDNSGSAQTGAGKIAPVVTVDSDVETSISTDHVTIEPVPDSQDMSFRLSTADGSLSHTWTTFAEYDPSAPFTPGKYVAEGFFGSAQNEGFETPYFYGRTEFELREDEIARPEILCTLGNTMMTVDFDPSVTDYFKDCEVTLHSHGGGFVVYAPGEHRQAYLRPGDIDVSVALSLPDGKSCDFLLTTIPDAKAAYSYVMSLSAHTDGENPVITISLDDRIESDDVSVELTPAFIAGGVPPIYCSGFVSGVPVHVAEGTTPSERVTMKVERNGLRSLILTVDAPSLLATGWTDEINLLDASEAMTTLMAKDGLRLTTSADGVMEVDFTDVVARLRADDGDVRSMFALRAVSSAGQMSEPAVLEISIGSVDVDLLAVTPATVGVDEATMTVECHVADAIDNVSVELFGDDRQWKAVKIDEVIPTTQSGRYILRFRVPDGTTALNARLLYCGAVRAETKIGRVSPKFSIAIDAFARKAVVRIEPEDEALLEVITRKVAIYNGDEMLRGVTRTPENGEITVTGLTDATAYALRATVMESPSDNDFTQAVGFTTEKALPLPNGDFEEVKNAIDWRDMPSGGRYSQDIVEIFNRQNFMTWKADAPDKWANVNAKTFCTSAQRPNTWYMQPSAQSVRDAYSGSYAVRIDNVGWDTDGKAIADYLQEGMPYVAYSKVVPDVAYRAVGKLFLGSYSFDASSLSERYEEGIGFTSRPASLNGFYKFSPSASAPSQTGMALVEVIGTGTDGAVDIIASGRVLLEPATGYTAFSIPLTYMQFGVKAVGVRVMLAASPDIGDIPFETRTTPTVPQLEQAAMLGSTLWVDGLTFSY